MQVCRLRPHPGPPGAAVLQVERRHLHHLLASVPAAGAEPLHAGGRPPLPGPPVSPPRGAGPDRQPAPQRLQAVHLLEVRGPGGGRTPGHPQVLRAEDQGGVPQPGRMLQRVQTGKNRHRSGPL